MATKTVESTEPHTTVIETRGGGGGAGIGIAIAVILLLAVAIGGYFLMQNSRNDTLRTDAVTSAAGSVAGAADNIGSAAGKAADNMTPSAPAPANQ